MEIVEVLEIILAVLTFPISIIALIVNAIFHIGFWVAWVIVLIVSIIIGGNQ